MLTWVTKTAESKIIGGGLYTNNSTLIYLNLVSSPDKGDCYKIFLMRLFQRCCVVCVMCSTLKIVSKYYLVVFFPHYYESKTDP